MSEFRENISWLMKFYMPIKGKLILIATQAVAVALCTAAIPYFFIGIIDGITKDITGDFLLKSVILLAFLGFLDFFLGVTNAIRRALVNLLLEWQYRQKTFEKIIRVDLKFYEKFRVGDIITRLTDDVGDKLSWFAASGVFRAWEASLRILFCLIAMSFINPILCLVAFIPLPIQFLVFALSANILRKRFKALQQVISRVNETIESSFSGIKILQSFCIEKRLAEKFSKVAAERADTEISAEKAHILIHSLYHYFWQFSMVFVLVAGGWMVIKGHLTIGEFVAFNYYVLHLVWPMFDISGLLVRYKRASVSIKRINELENYTTKITTPENPEFPKNSTGQIVFEKVSVKIKEKTILQDISFDIKNKRMIAVVGEVGCGKSTLLQLLCRLFDPDTGEVLLDGINLKKWDLKELRKKTGYVSQEPLLFTDSVKNNIKFGREDIGDEKIYSSSDIAQLSDEVKSFTDGYETSIGLRGMTVSGGQKQRISIARALAGSPDILILDDATAHLDADTESTLWNYIYKVIPDMRIFLVSHRPSTLEKADLILVLKDGKLVEQGKHVELIKNKGEYYRIYSKEKLSEFVG